MSTAKVDSTTRAAIDWMLRLESGNASPSERQVFKAWLAEDPAHLAAWQRVANALSFNPRARATDPDLLKQVQRMLNGRSFFTRHKALQHALLAVLVGLGVLASGLLCQG